MPPHLPTVLTLDAGGTNFVFSAIHDFKQIVEPVTLPAEPNDLEKCIATIIHGFDQISEKVSPVDAISFAFPGPANYELGIIENLPNFKAFNGSVPLGPILQNRFEVPVYINNDGDLFASGVARVVLPELNSRLRAAGSKKQFYNLIGLTLGTGFGCGIVINGQLLTGDNSNAAGIHNTLNHSNSKWNAEESVSTRAIQRVYAERAGLPFDARLMPKEIYQIAKGHKEGNAAAALQAFFEYGKGLGNSISNILTLVDGLVVLGGGLSASWDLFSPSMFNEIHRKYENFKGENMDRLSVKVFNLEDPTVFNQFAQGEIKQVAISGTDKTIEYDAMPRTGIALSKTDASLMTSLGAYAFVLQKSDK